MLRCKILIAEHINYYTASVSAECVAMLDVGTFIQKTMSFTLVLKIQYIRSNKF